MYGVSVTTRLNLDRDEIIIIYSLRLMILWILWYFYTAVSNDEILGKILL